jgi:hypothetical protein
MCRQDGWDVHAMTECPHSGTASKRGCLKGSPGRLGPAYLMLKASLWRTINQPTQLMIKAAHRVNAR